MKGAQPTIETKDLKVTPRVKKSAEKVAGKSLTIKADRKKHDDSRGVKKVKSVTPNAAIDEAGKFHHHKTPQELDRPNAAAIKAVNIETGEQLDHHPGILVLKDDLETFRYSHSFCKTYSICHAKGYFYRQKAPSVPVFAMERGTVIHSILEDIEVNPNLDPVKKLDEYWGSKILSKFKEFSDKDKSEINGSAYEETLNMLEDWVYENLDMVIEGRIRPEDCEVEFNLPVTFHTKQGSFQRLFNGKIDLVLWNKDRTSYVVLDYKSNIRQPSENALALEPQFTLYQWAATQLFGFPPKKMFWYQLRGVHKTPEEHDPPLMNKNTGELLKKSPSFSNPKPGSKEKGHPRVPECLKYTFECKIRPPAMIDDYFNNFVMGVVIGYESGDMTKSGRADPDNNCERCQYKSHCDKTNIELPFHAVVLDKVA